MKRQSIVLRGFHGAPLATVAGTAVEIEGLPFVVHRRVVFRKGPDGYGLVAVKPKGQWQVSEPLTGMAAMGSFVTCNSPEEAIEHAKQCAGYRGTAGIKELISKTLERYAQALL